MPGQKVPAIAQLLRANRIIGAAELIAFAGGAIAVVPAPGAGKLIWPVTCIVIYNFNTVDFSNTPSLTLEWHGTGLALFASPFSCGLGVGVSGFGMSPCGVVGVVGENVSDCINQPLDLVNLGGVFALGGVGNVAIGAPGTGYALNDTGTITTGNGDAHYKITGVGALGVVTHFIITAIGSGYVAGNGQATATGAPQAGIGMNFTVNINSILDGDGSLKVTTLYQVIDVP